MYWIHRKDEFGEARRARSKPVTDSGRSSGAVAVRSSSARLFLLNLADPLTTGADSSSSNDVPDDSASAAGPMPDQSNPPETVNPETGAESPDFLVGNIPIGLEGRSLIFSCKIFSVCKTASANSAHHDLILTFFLGCAIPVLESLVPVLPDDLVLVAIFLVYPTDVLFINSFHIVIYARIVIFFPVAVLVHSAILSTLASHVSNLIQLSVRALSILDFSLFTPKFLCEVARLDTEIEPSLLLVNRDYRSLDLIALPETLEGLRDISFLVIGDLYEISLLP